MAAPSTKFALTEVVLKRPLTHDTGVHYAKGSPAGWSGTVDETTGVIVLTLRDLGRFRMPLSATYYYRVSGAKTSGDDA